MPLPDARFPTQLRLVRSQSDVFSRKVEDELYRFRRSGAPVSLVFLSFPLTSPFEINSVVDCGLRRLDFIGMLGGGDFAVCLPHTDCESAERVAWRLRELTAPFPGRIGVVTADGGETFEQLLGAAKRHAKARIGVAA